MRSWWSGLAARLENRGWFFKVWGKTIANHVRDDFNFYALRFYKHPKVNDEAKMAFREIFMERDSESND